MNSNKEKEKLLSKTTDASPDLLASTKKRSLSHMESIAVISPPKKKTKYPEVSKNEIIARHNTLVSKCQTLVRDNKEQKASIRLLTRVIRCYENTLANIAVQAVFPTPSEIERTPLSDEELTYDGVVTLRQKTKNN